MAHAFARYLRGMAPRAFWRAEKLFRHDGLHTSSTSSDHCRALHRRALEHITDRVSLRLSRLSHSAQAGMLGSRCCNPAHRRSTHRADERPLVFVIGDKTA
jgi:hypothetical protein